jgi:hypothetical protein
MSKRILSTQPSIVKTGFPRASLAADSTQLYRITDIEHVKKPALALQPKNTNSIPTMQSQAKRCGNWCSY